MRKRLLMMAFAVLSVASSFAYEVGEYVYNSTQRFKIEGANLVTNGNFSDGLTGWVADAEGNAPSADVWSVETSGLGPNGENVIKSTAATPDLPLCGVWDLESGKSYVVSIAVQFTTAANTGVSTADAVESNCIDFFLNTDGAVKKVASTDDAPVVNVASSVYCPGEEWKTLVFFFTAGDNQKLVMRLEKLATDAMFTNIEIHEAAEVNDIRPVQQKIAFARQLMEDEVFNTADAADAKGALSDAIAAIEGMIETGELDDASAAESVVNPTFVGDDVTPSLLEQFLTVSTTNMNSQIKGIDIVSLAAYSRDGFKGTDNIAVGGGSWGHFEGADYLVTAIQNSYDHTGSITLSNVDFPVGKYFFTAEIRNANTGKASWPCPGQTFDLETTCKTWVGTTESQITIKGEDYQRVYLWGDVTEDGKFTAGVDWPNTAKGGAFYIRNMMVRFVGNPMEKIERKQAWDTFTAQWNAATGRRNLLIQMIGDKNYPWEQDSLVNAKEKWDVYYNAVIEKGWINENLTDPGKSVVTNEELTDWAQYQGVELYTEPDEEGNTKRLEFQVVRGYDYAIKYVQAQNKPIADLKDAITDAEKTRDDDMNSQGDKKTYQVAIDAAQAVYDDILANTNDQRHEADTTNIRIQQEALVAAKEVFLKSAVLTPIVDIDFANNFEKVETEDGGEYYVIKGTAGEMNFGTNVNLEDNKEAKRWAKGYGEELLDVIRVGNTDATVTLAEADIPGDDDVIRVNFDWWGGYLVKRMQIEVKFLNANNEIIAGFCLTRGQETAYNDFNNEANEGMDLSKYTEIGNSKTSNVAIKNDASNKSSFDLILDYKAQAIRGTINNSQKGISEGALMPFRSDVTDTKVVKVSFGSRYDNADRRSWFDNLKIYKYASQAEGPHQFGIKGDVNGDKAIDVADVVGIVNKILGEPNEDFLEAYADVTGDGKIDVDDVVAVVNIILGGSDAAAAPQLMNILLQNGFKF